MISAADVWSYAIRTLTSPVFGDLVTKNLTHVLSDSIAFAGADIAIIKTGVAAILVDTTNILADTSAILVDTSTLLTRLTATRAGYLDNLSGGAVALASVCTEARLSCLDVTISTRSSHSAADVWAVVSRTLTSPVFGDLVTKNLTAILSDSTAFKGADVATILSEIQNSTYGLARLDTEIDSIYTTVTSIYSYIINPTYGFPHINADLDTLLSRLTAARAGYLDNINNAQLLNIPNLSTLTAARIGYLDNINNAQLLNIPNLSTLTSARIGYLDNINQAGLLQVTATRAAYLDNLSGGAVALASVCTEARLSELGATNIPADIDTLLTRVPAEVTQRAKSTFKVVEKFFADSARITVTGTAGSQTIKSNFSISLIPAGVTIDYVHIYVFSQVIENTNASANKVNGAQNVQVQKTVGGAWTNCISILDDALRVPGTATVNPARDMARLLGAPIDCKAEVSGNGNYNLQWTNAQMDLDSMNFDDIFFIVEVGFH